MINKSSILPIVCGIVIGLALLLANILMTKLNQNTAPGNSTDTLTSISFYSLADNDKLATTMLSLFNASKPSLSDSDGSETSNLLSEDVTIRIVAQAKVGARQSTMLEITSKSETKRIQIQEGDEVNGVLIKSVSDKQLIVEKDGIEHSIKLFHPKELNSTNTK